MQANGDGDAYYPFSVFIDKQKILTLFNDPCKSAPASAVSNLITLPQQANKKVLKTYLRDKAFLPNHDIRCVLFKSLVKKIRSNPAKQCGESEYEQFVNEYFPGEISNDLSELKFPNFAGEEQLPWLSFFTADGRATLYKILACVQYNFPFIVYSPLLAISAALFLMYDDNPGQVFSHLSILVNANTKMNRYNDKTREDNIASALVLKNLSIKFSSTSHKSLMNLTNDPDGVYNMWIQCLFHGLPLQYVVVLFDMYLLEGYKSLYRVALAILKVYRKCGTSNLSNIVNAVFQFVQNIESNISVAALFKKACNFKLPTSKDIVKLHRTTLSTLTVIDSNIADSSACNEWLHLSKVNSIKSEIAAPHVLSTLFCWLPEVVTLMEFQIQFSSSKHGYSLKTLYSCVDECCQTLLLVQTTDDYVFGAYLPTSWSERKNNSGFFGSAETFLFALQPEAKVYRWVGISKMSSSSRKTRNDSESRRSLTSVTSNNKTESKRSSACMLPPISSTSMETNAVVMPSVSQSHYSGTTFLPPLTASDQRHVEANEKALAHEETSSTCDMFMMGDDSGFMIGGGGGGFGLYIDADLNHGTTQRCSTFNNKALVPEGRFTCSVIEVISFFSSE